MAVEKQDGSNAWICQRQGCGGVSGRNSQGQQCMVATAVGLWTLATWGGGIEEEVRKKGEVEKEGEDKGKMGKLLIKYFL